MPYNTNEVYHATIYASLPTTYDQCFKCATYYYASGFNLMATENDDGTFTWEHTGNGDCIAPQVQPDENPRIPENKRARSYGTCHHLLPFSVIEPLDEGKISNLKENLENSQALSDGRKEFLQKWLNGEDKWDQSKSNLESKEGQSKKGSKLYSTINYIRLI